MSIIANKNVLITGGASGIGKKLAYLMAIEGAHIVIWDINRKHLDEVTNAIKSRGYAATGYYCDVSDKEQIEVTAQKVKAEIGKIDILVNNAGVVFGKSYWEYSDEEIQKTIKINLMAHLWTIKAFLPEMRQSNSGHIVTIASSAGITGVANLSVYSVSKFANFGLDESLRQEFQKAGLDIKTTVVCPYFIDTGMFKGVKSRFSFLLPILKENRVARRIFNAIKKDKSRVVMPLLVYTVWLLRLVPVKIYDFVSNMLGVNASMDEFTGRIERKDDQKKTNLQTPPDGEYTTSYNPATGEVIGYSKLHTPKEVKDIIRKAKIVQKEWARFPLGRKICYLKKVRSYMVDHLDELAEVISRDNGKPRIDALSTELIPAVMALSYYCSKARSFLRKKRIWFGNIMLSNKQSALYRIPYGVIGIISPWNYPFGIPFSEVVMALLAGNTVVLKVASNTQMVGRKLEECFLAAGLPENVFNYVNIPGSEAGDVFLENGVDKLFFTGSVPIGKKLMTKAGKNLTPLVLELGGNDAMLVCPDADIYRAATGAVWAGLSNAGQSCGGVERIYVHEKVYDEFLYMLKNKVDNLRVGYDTDYNVDMGSMTKQSQVETVKVHVNDALNKGAKIYAQAKIPKGYQNFYPATVLTEVDHTMKVMKDETFGPVVAVMKVRNMEDAIELANDSNLGLTGSVWSKDKAQAIKIARRIKAGAVTINDHLMSHGLAETPWGGFKESGIGRTHGKIGFDEMTQPQVIVNDILPFARKNIWWHPYSKKVYDGLKGIIQALYGTNIKMMMTGWKNLLKIVHRYFTVE